VEHVVFFAAPDGAPSFRRVAGLEEAVRLVEHLRNVDGVHQVSVHALGDEVPLAFRTWYRVEVPADGPPVVPAQAAPEPVPVPAPAEPLPVAEPAPVAEHAVAEHAVAEHATAEEPVADELEAPAVAPAEEPVPVAVAAEAVLSEPSENGRHEVKSLGFFAN
jgi:hypothetical protein